MGESLLKLGLMFAMFVLTVIVGVSPLKILHLLRHEAATAQSSSKHANVSLILCLLTCFSGGVFFATCFLHLFPELRDNLNLLHEKYEFDSDAYPYAELLACLGFFLIFLLEEMVIMILPSIAHGHGHGGHGSVTPPNGVEERGGGCCMVEFVEDVKTDQDVAADETTALTATTETKSTKRANSEDKEGDGHCQTHCPLTVHERRGSNKCTANATHTFAPVAFAEPERCETNCEAVDEDPPILMKSRPHAHSHGVRSITFVLALGIHSLIEGVAFGLLSERKAILALFVSLIVHKLIVAFSVGLQLFRTHAHQIKWVIMSIFTLASMTPLGALLGILVTSAAEESMFKQMVITVLQGLAVGTFIYVTFFEVLLHERDNEHPNLLKLLVMFIGFALIGGIRVFDSHGHAHHGGVHTHEPSNPLMIFDDVHFH